MTEDLRPAGQCDDEHDCEECNVTHFAPRLHAREWERRQELAGEILAAESELFPLLEALHPEVRWRVAQSVGARFGVEEE
jgi:hypothetical protein